MPFPFLSSPWQKMMMEEKIVKPQKSRTALCDLTKKRLASNFVSAQTGLRSVLFCPKPSNKSGGQTHGWILFNFFCLLYQFLFWFFAGVLKKILMIYTFSQKENQTIWLSKNKLQTDIMDFFKQDPSMRLASRLIWIFGPDQSRESDKILWVFSVKSSLETTVL